MQEQPPTKLAVLLDHMRAERWAATLALAATFPDLGDHKEGITRDHQAGWNPGFFP